MGSDGRGRTRRRAGPQEGAQRAKHDPAWPVPCDRGGDQVGLVDRGRVGHVIAAMTAVPWLILPENGRIPGSDRSRKGGLRCQDVVEGSDPKVRMGSAQDSAAQGPDRDATGEGVMEHVHDALLWLLALR